jgi:hypothetical protein
MNEPQPTIQEKFGRAIQEAIDLCMDGEMHPIEMVAVLHQKANELGMDAIRKA